MASTETAMVVLTSKNLPTMAAEGGCAYWRAKKSSILDCKYLIATRNRHSTWVQGNEPHGAAFLIGEISGVKEVNGRFVVQLSRYGVIDVPNVWPGVGANPVRYVSLADIPGIDLNRIEWKPWPVNQDSTSAPAGLTIENAKAGLALTFGVKPEQIEITIKG